MKCIKNLLLILLLTTVGLSFGQLKETLFKGSLVLTNGQTKEGFIKDQSISEYTKEVKFKTAETDEKFEIYTPENLKSFTTQNGHYYENLSLKLNNNTLAVTLIAQKILKGKASLYVTYYNNVAIYVVENNGVFNVLQNDDLEFNALNVTKYNFKGILNIATEGFAGNIDNISFDQQTFTDIITKYNQSKGSESTLLMPKEKAVKFFTAYGGFGKGLNDIEVDDFYIFQANYRIYLPSISRSTSINVGFNYIYNKFDFKYSKNITNKFTAQIFTVPLTIQQNFTTSFCRPYGFCGFAISKVQIKNDEQISMIESGLQKDFGFTIVYGGGIEVDIFKGITTKIEYRSDLYTYYFVGIGYNFIK